MLKKKNAVGSKDLNECVPPYCEAAYSVLSPTEGPLLGKTGGKSLLRECRECGHAEKV